MPKFYLIYFKCLLDLALAQFFEVFNNQFQKVDGRYVLSSSMSKQKMASVLKKLVIQELRKIVSKHDKLHPEYYLVIGSCMPEDNLLLEFRDSKRFPEKLDLLVKSKLKYLLREKDIDIDIQMFNCICTELTNKMLCDNLLAKSLGQQYKNVIFVQHKRLDCYSMFKVLKHIYGKSSCVNVYKELKLDSKKQPLAAVNELVDKHVSKAAMNKSVELMKIEVEVKQYVDQKASEA